VIFSNQFNTFSPSGKSIPFFRIVVKPWNQKYIASVIPKYLLHPRRLILSTRGVSRSPRTLGWDAVDAEVPIANGTMPGEAFWRRRVLRTAKTCGPDVAVLASTHLEATASQGATEAKEPFSGESTL
jgi:hypothetical protein